MMIRKRLSLVIALVLILLPTLTPTAFASGDLVFDKDTYFTPTGYFLAYDSITVRSGVTVTVDSGIGFEIMDRLTVEPGGQFICSGEGPVQFNFAMKHFGSSVTGLDLYYPQKWDDGIVSYELISEPFVDTWTSSFAWSEMNPQFKWVEAIGDSGGWCLIWPMAGNPFNSTFFHGGKYMEVAERDAMLLRSLGLFLGTGDIDGVPNFELSREATRAEGLVMLLRLLGKQDEVLAGSWENPFTDRCWADNYIGYAYENGLTLGRGDGTFGYDSTITAQEYMTFLLRALGYPEDGGALYREALDTAAGHGLCTVDGYPFRICVGSGYAFWRADMVMTSLQALRSKCFGADAPVLADKLGITL